MKRLSLTGILASLLAICAVASAADNPVYDIANILSGTFQGSTPGNELRLDFRPVPTDPQHPYDLFVEVTGKYLGQNVRRQGLLRLESQGRGVYVGFIPKFDATVTALSPDATRFSESEANAACGFTLRAQGDGFSGETTPSVCAVALRGGTGKWSIELEPGTIRLRNVVSGETLRFRRQGK
ncbi:MAG TPA: hypothetical protein VEO37_08225 [Thermoanaerobaculia bacterium]|nr:hypothetical protein [Thermoanaerobaculia bacterium]